MYTYEYVIRWYVHICVYQGVRNVSFSESFAYGLSECPLNKQRMNLQLEVKVNFIFADLNHAKAIENHVKYRRSNIFLKSQLPGVNPGSNYFVTVGWMQVILCRVIGFFKCCIFTNGISHHILELQWKNNKKPN